MDNKGTKKQLRNLLILTVRYIFNCKDRNLSLKRIY